MPLTALDAAAGTFDWHCTICRHPHTGHAIAPERGHVQLSRDATGVVDTLIIGPCEGCGAWEALRLHPGPWETGEWLHPDSLVGTRLPGGDGGNIVVGHHIGGVIESGLSPEHRAQATHIRALQAHPHLAGHAPLRRVLARRKDDPPDAPLVEA